MRTIGVGAVLLATILLSPAKAAPWCASYGGGNNGGGGTNCGFYTFEQCLAAKSGNGGFCDRNPFELGAAGSGYAYAPGPQRRPRRHR
jgi:hypothetical protein